jgi:two-component system OmpR family sensor kinase
VLVRADRDALERAVDNLLDNARRHGPAGGEIAVGVELEDADGRPPVARLWVRDEGPGLAPEDTGRAFERFWRGPRRDEVPGTGLGLAIVRATAERHGGRVTVSGPRFAIELPALEAVPDAPG